VLPISGLPLALREPDGFDELSVLESPLQGMAAMLDLARRVATLPDGAPVGWDELPAADLGGLSLLIRRAWIGESIRTGGTCPEPGCGERFDVSFPVSPYLAYHRPRRPRGVVPAPVGGWFTLAGSDVRFRIPSVGDVLAAAAAEDPGLGLAARCIDPPGVPSPVSRRIDRALSALAPSLEGVVGGNCPTCGAALSLAFDPLAYTLAELRDAFQSVYAETHALASAYGWTEEAILAMPRSRRRRYAALIAQDRARL
jgi:hypothetical protein